MEEKIKTLFKQYSGSDARRVEPLPVSGSARRYYRVFTGDRTYVGVYHEILHGILKNPVCMFRTCIVFRRTGFVIYRMI